ncbi:MAG: ABC transporter permease [Prevotella sp.]|nr:ABC transporter permease [Prevotella sp.]MCM1075020.1 ABC transporter permease [Ruminococcus sp.]
MKTGFRAIFMRSLKQLASRPLYWYAMFVLPLFIGWFLTDEMKSGLPENTPTAIIDKDRTHLSRQVTQTLDGMQLVKITEACESYSEAMDKMRSGDIFGFFLIPENYEADLLAGRAPVISFYTNMTYFVPGTLAYKNFKTTAVYTKAGVVMQVIQTATGATPNQITPLLNPVNIEGHPIGNPWLNYSYYLCNSFVPGILQLMVMLTAAYALGEEIKKRTSVQLMQMAGGSVLKALTAKLMPQTCIWSCTALLMEAWLFGYNQYPMNGSLLWMTINTVLLVLASQGMAILVFCALPSLRMAVSVCSLIGILTFSIAAFSFPVESMYGAVGIFSWIVPVRYYFLIYADQALNGIDIYFSRWHFIAYFVFIFAPLLLIWRLKKAWLKPIYLP